MRLAVGLWSTLLLGACDSGPSDEEITAAVEAAFDSANPQGRTGLLIKGRDGVVWWQAGAFTNKCLEENDLAFNDDPTSRPANAQGLARISPTYKNQWTITAATDTGYCIDLGADPKIEVKDISKDIDGYRVVTAYSMGTPTKWFECLRSDYRDRLVEVGVDAEGQPVVNTDLSLFQGDCPHPLPPASPRKAGTEPTAAAPSAPTAAQLQSLAAAFDEALASRNGEAAAAMVSCYNLYEEKPYGACAVSEIIPHGSMKDSEANPWMEYAIKDFTAFSKTTRDRENPSIYHVPFKHKRSGETRSISVQWAGGEWKLLGVVSRKSAGLTVARIVNDLHDREKRDIFGRRVAGEDIDDSGQPNNPQAEALPN